jgi:DNA modification methylase
MSVQILIGDCLDILPTLPDASVNCCVTSPPYWGLRDYGVDGQLGLEKTPEEYTARMVEVFREVRRVLRDDGTLWLNLGDSYVANGSGQVPQTKSHKGSGLAGPNRDGATCLEPKNLVGIPWRVAFALQSDGWYLRQDIIWHKPNPMPESVTDRCTKAHEYIFLLSKNARYYYDSWAIADKAQCAGKILDYTGAQKNNDTDPKLQATRPKGRKITVAETRNRRSVWTVPTKPYSGAHFATYPPELITPCILAGCPKGGTVIDPFGGSGTTGEVCEANGRNSILIELNEKYCGLIKTRTAQMGLA